MNAILERILTDKPVRSGRAYRKFSSRTSGFATSCNELVVKHYIHRVVNNNGIQYAKPEYTYALSIRKYGGVWWIVWWGSTVHATSYLPWNYVTADDALNAMLAISDAIIA